MNLNYTRILHFLTTVKHMNMNKAAKELYISQPALSLSISRLEEDLGVSLFYRDKNKLVLSREARILLPRFQQLRSDYELLIQEAELLHSPRQDQFINISFSGSKYFFASLHLTGILNQFDQIIPKLCYIDVDQAEEMLLSGQIDFAIACPLISHPKITTLVLLTEPIGLVLPDSHPFACKKSISLHELETIPIHGLSKENTFRNLCDSICAAHNIQIDYVTESNIADYNQLMTGNNGSGCFLATPANYDMNFKPSGNYVYLTIDGSVMNRKMGLSYLTDSDIQYKYANFVSIMQENINQLNYHHHDIGKSIMASVKNIDVHTDKPKVSLNK